MRRARSRTWASVVAYITHPVLSGPAVERIEDSVLDQLVVTDTIPLREEARACRKIRQLSVRGCWRRPCAIRDEERELAVHRLRAGGSPRPGCRLVSKPLVARALKPRRLEN